MFPVAELISQIMNKQLNTSYPLHQKPKSSTSLSLFEIYVGYPRSQNPKKLRGTCIILHNRMKGMFGTTARSNGSPYIFHDLTLSLRILTNLTSNTNPNIPSITLFHFLLLLSTIRYLSYPNDEDESNPNLNFINTFIQLLIWYLAFAIIRSGFKCPSASGAIDPQEIAPCTIILGPLANTNASKF